jgi:hypothetical protein
MAIPGVHIETLFSPALYTASQLERACLIAAALNRGKLILVDAPLRSEAT